MKEQDIDKLLKEKIDYDVKAPESLKNRIHNEINNIPENKKAKTKYRIMQSVAAVVVVSVLGLTTYATVTKNPILEKMGLIKGSEKFDEESIDINQDLSNEYANIKLAKLAADNAYAIMKYDINLNESGLQKYGKIEKNELSGYNIYIENSIQINNVDVGGISDVTEYVTRVSETKYEIYQVINITNIESKDLNIEISEKYLVSNEETSAINKKVIISATKPSDGTSFEQIKTTLGNKKITIDNFQNTGFETFIKVSVDVENLTQEDLTNLYSENNPENISFTVLDKNNNYISNRCYTKITEIYDSSAHLEFLITLGNLDVNIKDLKVVPYTFVLPNERSNELDIYYNNLDWHKLQDGNYSKESNLGGKITVTKIETTDETIRFYFNLTGFITGYEDYVILRMNDDKLGFNAIYPTNTYIKNLDAEQTYIEFDRNIENVGIYSNNFKDEDDYKLNDLSKVEFALLAEPQLNTLSNGIQLGVPEQKSSYLTINSVTVQDLDYDFYSSSIYEEKNDIDDDLNNNDDATLELDMVDGIYEDRDVTALLNLKQNTKSVFNSDEATLGSFKIGMLEEDANNLLNQLNTDNIYIDFEDLNGNDKNMISYMYTDSSTFEGPRGIKVGDSEKNVLNKFRIEELTDSEDIEGYIYIYRDNMSYGRVYVTGPTNLIEYYNNGILLTIDFDESGLVSSIEITMDER